MRDHQPVPPPLDGFRPVGYLGSGGFGEVFLYEDVSTSARFAIKVLREGSLAMGGTQLMQEAQALGRLSANGPHPNIVAVQRVSYTRTGRPYLVMEYCPGGSWAQQIGQKGRIHPSKVLSVGIQIAGALHMAHRQGIVHRDIKPGNILIGARIGGQGIPKLGDFGIAALTADEVARGSAWMSRDYCAPEVLESGEADELADVFALAATLYHALAGHSWVRDPDGDNSPDAIEHRIRTSPVPSIGSNAPETLEYLLRAAMNRDRSVRAMTFPTAKDFALRLQDVELELQYPQTRLPVEEADYHTGPRLDLPPPRVNEQLVPPPPPVMPASFDSGPAQWTGRTGDVAAQAATGRREVAEDKQSATLEQPRRRVPPLVWVGTAVAALAVGGIVLANVLTGAAGQPGANGGKPSQGAGDPAVTDRKPVPVPTVKGERVDADSVKFTWTYPDAQEGDTFRVLRRDGSNAPPVFVTGPEWTLDGVRDRVCVVVTVVRADRRTTERGGEDCAE